MEKCSFMVLQVIVYRSKIYYLLYKNIVFATRVINFFKSQFNFWLHGNEVGMEMDWEYQALLHQQKHVQLIIILMLRTHLL